MENLIVTEDAILINKSVVKSETFNRVKVADKKSEDILKKLISDKFYSIPNSEYWRQEEANELIKVALNLGFSQLAAQMTNDNF